MKALSLLQPWASLVVLGHKHIETRSWNTKYRGKLLIHASGKKGHVDLREDEFYKHYCPLYERNKIEAIEKLPIGSIIGKVNLLEVITTERARELIGEKSNIFNEEFLKGNKEKELAFGDYSEGRYAWLLSDPVLFKKPIPAKGQLGIWNYEGGIEI